jgi:hypothetical protein
MRMGTTRAIGSIRLGRMPQRGLQAVSTTAAATQPQSQLAGFDTPASRLAADPIGAGAWERDQLLDRLRDLRRVLPVLAQEMAAARRQAARLRIDNQRLSEQVRDLRVALDARGHEPA